MKRFWMFMFTLMLIFLFTNTSQAGILRNRSAQYSSQQTTIAVSTTKSNCSLKGNGCSQAGSIGATRIKVRVHTFNRVRSGCK